MVLAMSVYFCKTKVSLNKVKNSTTKDRIDCIIILIRVIKYNLENQYLISNRVSYIEYPVAQITCDKDYSICITISHFKRKNMSDTLFAIMNKVFDVTLDNVGTLRLSKKHLTLEQVVQLVDFYYKVIN